VVLESSEASNRFAPQLKRRHAVREALLCFRNDREDRVAQLGECCSLGFVKRVEVLVDVFVGHIGHSQRRRREGRARPSSAVALIDAAL
jgi:hypothetical protein